MSRILFISSDNTGKGHDSIYKALHTQIINLDQDVQVDVADGFLLGGPIFRKLSSLYNPLAVNLPVIWDICYKAVNILIKPMNYVVSRVIRKKLIAEINRIAPDIIVSVHPVFVGSVLNILEEEDLDIPVMVFIADLDNVSALWADKRTTCTICPTQEAEQRMLELGISDNKLKVTGFPVREAFCGEALPLPPDILNRATDSASVLIVNGSQGQRHVRTVAESLLDHTRCQVKIIAGNNTALKKSLESDLSVKYKERVDVFGFVQDMAGQMSKADILIIRASPNVMMEAVNLCKPIIIIGALTGQEKKNPDYAVKHRLGVFCKDIKRLPETISALLANKGAGLRDIYEGQAFYRTPQAAREIATLIIRVAEQPPLQSPIRISTVMQQQPDRVLR